MSGIYFPSVHFHNLKSDVEIDLNPINKRLRARGVEPPHPIGYKGPNLPSMSTTALLIAPVGLTLADIAINNHSSE